MAQGEEEETLGDRLADGDSGNNPDEVMETRELIGTLRTAIGFLPEIQREVVRRYYLDGELLRDIAASMGVTEARVSQIRAEALNAMRAYFSTAFDGVEQVEDDAPGRRRRAAFVAAMSARSTWRTRLEAAEAAEAATRAGANPWIVSA
jgi:RNA polymerase sigma factor for flagellar operon FliA